MAATGPCLSCQDDSMWVSSCAWESDHEPGYISEKDWLLAHGEHLDNDAPLAGDGPIANNKPSFPFLDLKPEIQLRVVDFLDFGDLAYFRATCRTMRTLPTQSQRRKTLLDYERDRTEFRTLWQKRDRAEDKDWIEWIYSRTSFRKLPCPLLETYYHVPDWSAELDRTGLSTFRIGWYTTIEKPCPISHPKLKSERRYVSPDNKYRACHMCLCMQRDWAYGDKSLRHYCLWCRLTSPDKLIRGSGWLQTSDFVYGGDWYHICCSRCEKLQFLKFEHQDHQHFCDYCYQPQCDWRKMKYEYCRCWTGYDSDGSLCESDDDERVKGDDETICNRLFESDLCKDCFTEENKAFFTFKQRLRDKIAAMGKYLRYMDQVDECEEDLKLPSTEDLLELDCAVRQ